ncbi:ribonuclease H-like domain-containing protein [Tanacetum coccineum]
MASPTTVSTHQPPTIPIGVMGPIAAPAQATTLPNAFNVETLHDPDFMTRRVLLRCDIIGDLYPVTTPSLIPQTFLVSQHAWHQRLGHPRSEVLRRLVSNNLISCNKEKPPTLYHACQLGKHVILSFGTVTPTSASNYKFLDDYLDITPPILPTANIPNTHPTTNSNSNETNNHEAHLTPSLSTEQTLGSAHTSPSITSPHVTSIPTPAQVPTSSIYAAHDPVSTQEQSTMVHDAPTPSLNTKTPSTNPNPTLVHHMVTQFHVGTNRPTKRLTLQVSSLSPLPKHYRDAFSNPNWQNAMHDEYNALIKNNTWILVPRPMNTNIVRCMWLFRHNFLLDGTHSHYKARLVANGSTQVEGIDVDETFSPIVKPGTIQTVLSLARLIASLHQEFSMTDLCSLNYFFGISITRDSIGMFLSQRKYATEILERAHMVGCNSSQTPVDNESKLGDDGDHVSDPTLYKNLAGSLQYLTFTRPYISFAVQQVCIHMHDPWEPHLSALKRILHYVRGTLDFGFAEAEYRGVANAVVETCWLRNLLRELHTPLSSVTLVYCDNVKSGSASAYKAY